jgi:tetratricopeptide (TPR) repeat protein
MRSIVLATVAVLALSVSAQVFAAGSGSGGMANQQTTPADPNYVSAKAMIEAKNYAGAMPLLQQVVAKNPKDADAYTLMGYATRKSGDPNGSLQYYNTALGIDPKHIGAHEYVGEAYLQLGRLPEAEQHLARLDSICVFGCVEYRDLKAAVANYKAGKKPTN